MMSGMFTKLLTSLLSEWIGEILARKDNILTAILKRGIFHLASFPIFNLMINKIRLIFGNKFIKILHIKKSC